MSAPEAEYHDSASDEEDGVSEEEFPLSARTEGGVSEQDFPLTAQAMQSESYKRRQSRFAKTNFYAEEFADHDQMRYQVEEAWENKARLLERHEASGVEHVPTAYIGWESQPRGATSTERSTGLPLALVHKKVTPQPRRATITGGRQASYWTPTTRGTFRRKMAGGAPNLNGRQHPNPSEIHGEHGVSRRRSVSARHSARNEFMLATETGIPAKGKKFPKANVGAGPLTQQAMQSEKYKKRQEMFAKTNFHHEDFANYDQMRIKVAEKEDHEGALVEKHDAQGLLDHAPTSLIEWEFEPRASQSEPRGAVEYLPLALHHQDVTPAPKRAPIKGGRKASYWTPTTRGTMARKMAGGAPNLNGRQHPRPTALHGDHGLSKRKHLSAGMTARNELILDSTLSPHPGERFPEAPAGFGPLTQEARKSDKYKKRQEQFAKTAYHHEDFADYAQMRGRVKALAEAEPTYEPKHESERRSAFHKVALYPAEETLVPLALVHKKVSCVPKKAMISGGRKAEYWAPTERKTFRRAMAGGAPNLNGRQHPQPSRLHGPHGVSKRHSVHDHMAARNELILTSTLCPAPGEKFPRPRGGPGPLTQEAMKSAKYKKRQDKFGKTSYDSIM